MAEYRLYCFGESGKSYKPALMLALSGCDWEPRWVDYFNGETRGDAYRGTVNELGEAPVLEAAKRADQLLDEGDIAGAETWHRILNAIERLQAKAEGEKVH
jgi:hypothetical protein